MLKYLSDALQHRRAGPEVPDMAAIAKEGDLASTLLVCRLLVAIAVRCKENKDTIERLRNLGEADMKSLRHAIEQVRGEYRSLGVEAYFAIPCYRDDHIHQIQPEQGATAVQENSLDGSYQSLLLKYQTLEIKYASVMDQKEGALAREKGNQEVIDRLDKELYRVNDEVEILQKRLHDGEEILTNAELEIKKYHKRVSELAQETAELRKKADKNDGLEDELDALRHAEKERNKMKVALDKCRERMQEDADLRQRLKLLEKQNASLTSQSLAFEEERRKNITLTSLVDASRKQISDLSSEAATHKQAMDRLNFELEKMSAELCHVKAKSAKASDALELCQERLREFELMSDPLALPEVMKDQCKEQVFERTQADKPGNKNRFYQDLEHDVGGGLIGIAGTDLKTEVRGFPS
ncbi:hypothetical protein DENSPDRAFT_919575 [Dentipellis sp. KUC8613]|nr:hypothetical protein DENSPDRAFT_919575 [Dentipellis sp. KUC8613]